MGIMDYLSRNADVIANGMGGAGEALMALSQGRAPNMAPYQQRTSQLMERQRLQGLKPELMGAMQGMDPRQQGILGAMYDASPQAAMGIMAQQAFPAAVETTDWQRKMQALQSDDPRVVQAAKIALGRGGRNIITGADGRKYYEDTQEPVLPNVQPKPQGAQSDIAKLTADYRAGLISEQDYTAKRDKILAADRGITIGPDGTIQIGGANAPTAIKTEAIKGRNAYESIMKGLDTFEGLLNEHGSTVLPGEAKDAYDVARRSLQLQMKELFNLGVLNGPDLELMDQLLIDPTSLSGAAMDATGYAGMKERGAANIAQLRQMMTELIAPKLHSAGAAVPGQPKAFDMKSVSDDALLKALGR